MSHHTWTLDTASNIHLFPFFHFCCVSGRPWICRTFTISLEPSRQMICWPVTCQVSECSEVTSDHGSSGTCRPHLGLGPLRPLGPMEPMFNNIDVAQYLENAPSGAFFLKGLQAVWHRIYKDTIKFVTKIKTDNWADGSLVSKWPSPNIVKAISIDVTIVKLWAPLRPLDTLLISSLIRNNRGRIHHVTTAAGQRQTSVAVNISKYFSNVSNIFVGIASKQVSSCGRILALFRGEIRRR